MTPFTMLPVQVLREHVTALEAALSVCLADPDGKPVHRLRTQTRRVEALLMLLELLPSLPAHRKPSTQLKRCLKKLRRAAGEVRDLDVHRKLLEGLASAEKDDAAFGDAEPDLGPETLADSDDSTNTAVLSHSAGELRERLGRERVEAAKDLQDLLRHQQSKTARAAEKLLEALEPAKNFALPSPDLLRDAELVLTRDGLLKRAGERKLNGEELHTVRKAAKRARYLAEMLPEDALLVEAAQGFEALQEAGGQWHDALELAQAARQHFGKAHLLTALYRAEREQRLETYRAALASRAAEVKENPKRDSKGPKEAGKKAGRANRAKASAADRTTSDAEGRHAALSQSAPKKAARQTRTGRGTRTTARQKTAA